MGEEEIISLIPLLLQGKATDEQERAVRCWLEENEGHLEIYRKYCAVYYRLYYAGEWKKIDVSRAMKQVKGQNDRRSEERRVGKECLRLCRSRWSPYH